VNGHHFAAPGKMIPPDFVALNQIVSRLQIVSSHHFVGSTNMVCAIPVPPPPWCPKT
jgi:hypothetical protein